MPARDLTCTATFTKKPVIPYTVTGRAGANGKMAPTSQKVNKGSTATFTVTPNTGYEIDTVTGCDGTLSGTQYTTSVITAHCTITATFKLIVRPQYLVSVSLLSGDGTVDWPDFYQMVDENASTTLVVTPNSGYVAQVEGCNGALSGNTYTTGPITTECVISVSFEPKVIPHTVKGTAGTGGSISPAVQVVKSGQTGTLTVTANDGYQIKSVTGCGGTLSGATFTTGKITSDCTVTATFEPKVIPYTVKGTAGTGGSISPAVQVVKSGQTGTLTVTANDGYQIKSVTGCGGTLSGTKFTTGTITGDCTVKATFELKPVYYAVTLASTGTGSGSTSGAGSFTAGSTVTLTATAASGSTFTGWSPSPCAASFTMPAKNLTCTATFTKDIPQPSDVPETVKMTGGCFQMGSPEDEPYHNEWGDETLHEVCVDDFEMGKYEVTFDEYDAFCDDTGRSKPDDEGWGRGKRPVIYVDWNDAVAYTEWLSKKTGQNYRLPTEAEWEYAARAGTTTPFWTGQCVNTDQANFYPYGYGGCPSDGTYRGQTVEVGSFPANPWGLHDTMGNVWEWTCSDWSDPYNGAEKKCSTSGTVGNRSIRGGSWFTTPGRVRSAFRTWSDTTDRTYVLGFRVVLPASRS